jgi:CheY-like chemotaxis protein
MLAAKVQLSSEMEGASEAMSTQRDLYKPLILCIDDDEGILDLIRMALESKGYRVLTANDGRAALEAFAACPIDAVVLDYEMPGMNGVEVAREMMRVKPNVPKLLFSGSIGIPTEETGVFQGYCSKPCGLFAITSQIKTMTGWARGV